MKCIIAALSQTEFRPRKRWWGYVDENKHFHLMRYGHTLAIFCTQTGNILMVQYCTRTDKAGVGFAISHFQSTFKHE